MRKLLLVFLAFFGLFLFNPAESKACIDPDTAIQAQISYDTIQVGGCIYIDEYIIRFTNLRLMNESPNKFCACGLQSTGTLFDDLTYIAFVDSGTNNPYQGFGSFDEDPMFSSAWNSVTSGSQNWLGMVSDVLASGLSANDPVELVVRAKASSTTPINLTACGSSTLNTELAQSSLGTDEWDPIGDSLAGSHRSIKSLDPAAPGNQVSSVQVASSQITQVDNDILPNITPSSLVYIFRSDEFEVYPNPAADRIRVRIATGQEHTARLTLLDMSGRQVQELLPPTRVPAESDQVFDLDQNLASGVYLLQLDSGDRNRIRKLVIR